MSAFFVSCRGPCSVLTRFLPVHLMPVRTRVLYHYTTKKKRLIKHSRTEANFDWAKAILEKSDAENYKKGVDEEPHMLHVVCLEKTTRGRPWWEKDIIEELGLEGKLFQPVILKNVPAINKMLFEVKHLVRIQPLRFPHGFPEHESDLEHMVLRSNGEMVVIKRLKEFEAPLQERDPKRDKWQLDLETVKKDLDKKLVDYNVHSEYFKANYEYRYNQDKKQYRYNFNKNVRKYEW